MRRYHLIELHEQPWYPAAWRRMFQEGLGRSLSRFGIYDEMTEPFARFLQRVGTRPILDLCSGSAEPVVRLWESLPFSENDKPELVLSDLYPDVAQFERARSDRPKSISYHPGPVDARSVPPSAPRVRTIFGALHHFKPDEVRAILRDAARHADGIAIFEPLERNWQNLVFQLPIPLFAAVDYFRHASSLDHMLWGVAVPVVPWTGFFDGIVSVLRSYTPEELLAFTRDIEAPDFAWEVGQVRAARAPGAKATYLFGWREQKPAAPEA